MLLDSVKACSWTERSLLEVGSVAQPSSGLHSPVTEEVTSSAAMTSGIGENVLTAKLVLL